MNVGDAIRQGARDLGTSSDTARLDAELLMAHALGVTRSDMLLRYMDAAVPGDYAGLIKRRSSHEPVAYITGTQEFYGRDFAVGPGILIPRGDSETLIDAIQAHAPHARSVLDLGTGSGALLITALLELEEAVGVGVDASAQAIRTAALNAANLGLSGETARFLKRSWLDHDWRDDLGRFDLILCNPPYVEVQAELAPDVREFEPASALFAGADGLDDYRILLPQLRDLMTDGALAILEIGANQAPAVTQIATIAGFSVEIRNDLANRPRCAVLR